MSVKYLLLIASIVLSFKISAQVTADFSSNTNSGCPNPLLVIISDMSTSSGGVINSWSWQIDGPAGFSSVVSSTNQVSSSLIISGFYSVSLTVCDNNNICDTKVELTFIEIFELPSYTYSISPIIGCAPQEVCFDIDIIPGCGTTANVLFDVNDGVVYRGDSFCHIYNTVGDYFDFTFSTENSCGCVLTETISDTISVVVIPTANLVADQNFSCTAPLNVNFTNMSIASSGATYIWNIPGLVSNVSTTNLTQSFGIGNYDVQLIVTEPGSCADTILFSNMISVGNNPIADFESVVLEVCEGESIQFNDSSNGTPVSWLWEVVGTAITSNSQNPMINFPNMGVFDIRLTTTYAGACQDVITKLALITVNSSPVNSFTITDSGSCVIPLNTVFNSTSTNSMNSVWSFPGGTPSSAIGNGPINVSYTNTGSYNISLSDTSINGCSATTNYNSVVNLEELTANFFSDNYYGCMPLSAIFSVTTNNVDPIVSYSWNLPGSNSGVSILEDPTAIYNSNSCFDVDLIVVSALGCRDTVVNDDFICVGISPIVNFDFTPISACFEEEDVCFTFTGSGADTLLWNFDDGPLLWSSPDSTPCHAYTSDLGNYSPTLIAFNNGCSSDTVTYLDSVSILGPIADFTSSLVSCVDWNTIEFTNSSLEADSSYWVFGDASVAFGSDTSTLVNPVWVYPPIDSVMNYTVTLVVYKDSFGCEDTITQAISVFPPDASFSISDSIGCTPFTINFQNTSLDVTSVGLDTRWNWVDNYYFGTSNVNTVWNGTSFRSKTYNTPGVYTIIMRNRDSRGCLDTIRKPNLITIHGTVVDFNSDITEGCLPLFINFYDSSFAPLTYIESWHWDFGTGNPADTSNIQNPSFVYIDGGYYTVTLSVVDSFGCTTILNLNNYIFAHEPLASFSLSDTFICDNQSVSVTNLSVGEVLTYDWQFQNGSPAVFNPTGSPPIISFNTEGTQDMYLEVTDNIGCVDDTTIVLPVFDITAAGVADIDFSVCSSPPLLVSFTNNSNNNIDSSSVLWDFGNGITSNDFNPSTLYSSPGEYIVTLAINSLTGCMDIAVIDTIVIEGPWGLVESINVNDLCGCDTAIFAIKTLNAINPTFLTGDGQAIPFSPVGLLGDTIYDTLKVAYCTLGSFIPSLYFSQGVCSYSVPVMVSDYIGVDSLASNFSYQNTVYCDTASICFTDLSENELNGSGNVHSWLWDFGDGNNSTIQNPCNFFDSPGVYNVCLTVSDSFLCEKTFCDSVLIRFNPIVAVGLSDSTICLGDEINFFDSSTLISGAILDSVFWNFGTGNSLDTSLTVNTSFTFLNAGIYNVSLDVYDNFGCHSIDSSQATVYNLPVIVAETDTFVCLGDSVQLNVNGASTYVWSPNTSLTDDTLSNPLSYSINDIQYFVTGIDVNGCSNIDSLDLTVSNVFASFDFPTACLGDAVFFTDLSSNVNGTTSLWSWNFNDPTSGLDSVSIIQNPSHVFNSSGNFDVVLSIENDKFCSADTLIQLNVNTAPEAIFVSDSVCLGLPVDFSSLLSTNGTGTIVQTHWDFGTGIVVDTSNITTPSFTFGAAGLYTVCLTVTSDLDCISNFDDTCMVVQIYNLPTTDENVDTVCLGNSNNFIDLTIAGDAPVIAEYWNFDQNINDTLLIIGNNGTTNFGYNTYGSYNVLHISIDANSCIDSSRVNVLVYDNPVSNFSFASNCINADNIFTSTSTNGLDGINTINQYSWDIDEGASFNLGADIETVDFNNLGMHNVSLIVTDNFGCTDTSTQNINILFAPIAQIILSDNDICIGETINLDGSSSNNSTPGVQYAWDDNYNSGIDNSLASYNISPMTDLQIMLVVTDDNNCVDTAFANMLTHENPVASFINDNGCINLPISLNSTSTSTDGIITNFDWLIDNVTTLTGENPAYIPLNNGTFNLQLIVESIHNCIDSSVIVSVTVDTTVVIDLLANDTVICAGTELPLEVIGTADNYLWLPANVFMDNTLESVIANIENTTNVSITGYSENDYCPEAIETLSVIVASAPSIDFTATPNPIFVGLTSEIELDVTPFNFKDSVIWDDNTSLNILEGLYVDATPEEETDYPFTVIYYFDSVRCTVDSFINIQVLDECNDEFIYAPNVFTPNNDAKNDVFGISGISVDHLNYLRIYDRWGKLMFEVENAEFKYGKMKKEDSWNGNSATGNYCNNGVYVIMYEAVCVNGSSVIGNGNVTLVR